MDNDKINSKDRKIIDAMMEGARKSAIELSEKTGLTRQTVNKATRRLEEDHVFWGYYPVVNMKALGKKVFIMFLRSKPNLTLEKVLEGISETQKSIKEQKSLIPIYSGFFHGYFDWIIIFSADNIVQANKVVRNWRRKYGDTIEDIQLQEELMSFRCGGFINPDFKKEINGIL